MKPNVIIKLFTLTVATMWMAGCKQKDDKPVEQAPVRVSVVVADSSKQGYSRIYSGTVESTNTTTLSFSVAGTIEELYVDEGQQVSPGRVLGKLKSGDYVNADNIAAAELAEAEDAYARLKKLHDANALPEIKWVEIQQKLKQAQNAAEISRRTLEETVLKSPVSGVISRKMADKGQNVAPVEPVFEVVSTEALAIAISIPENEIGNFSEGQTATIDFNNENIGSIEGKLIRKSIVADPLTRSYTVKISIPSGNGKILPGMVGNVVFKGVESGSLNSAIYMLPSQAVLLSADNKNFVWLVKDGKAERRFVTADELVSAGVMVDSGLNPGDTVIVEGMQKIGTGTPVEAILK